MPTVIMLVPDDNGVPALQLQEGEVLEYSIGNVDVWRDTEATEPNEPNPEDKWVNADPTHGNWTVYNAIADEEGAITGYAVTRRYLETVEAFRGGWAAHSAVPAITPNDGVAIVVTTSAETIATLDGRLAAVDGLYGIWGEVNDDA